LGVHDDGTGKFARFRPVRHYDTDMLGLLNFVTRDDPCDDDDKAAFDRVRAITKFAYQKAVDAGDELLQDRAWRAKELQEKYYEGHFALDPDVEAELDEIDKEADRVPLAAPRNDNIATGPPEPTSTQLSIATGMQEPTSTRRRRRPLPPNNPAPPTQILSVALDLSTNLVPPTTVPNRVGKEGNGPNSRLFTLATPKHQDARFLGSIPISAEEMLAVCATRYRYMCARD
jgi:hypothetical protein